MKSLEFRKGTGDLYDVSRPTVVKVIFIENTGDKLSRQLISLVDLSKGYNYYHTGIRVALYSDNSTVGVSTYYDNKYGDSWSNGNYTKVSRENIPFFTLKKLGMI